MENLTWVEISRDKLGGNIKQLRKIIGENVILCPCVKANAYGHGLIETGRVFLESGADWLGVNSLYEAVALRESGILSPIYIMGYVPVADLGVVVDNEFRLVVYNRETIDVLVDACNLMKKKAFVHIKVETGNNRQGVQLDEVVDFAKYILNNKFIQVEGISTHFANIEDTTDHSYAFEQLRKFREADEILKSAGITVPIRHCGNSAATMLFPETHFEMVRPGISSYGLWPSTETKISLRQLQKDLELKPALTWKCKIAQIKPVKSGEMIGYGCSYKAERDIRLAILPVGYYDGYSRIIGMKGHVLIKGKRAPIRGRICMNIMMVDVTEIPEAGLEDEVVLLGMSGEEEVTMEDMAKWSETINYEIGPRINERIERVYV